MITFTVHEEPSPRADRIDRAERLVFIKDGFSIIAAYLGPVWLLANRIWLPLIGYLGSVAALYLVIAGAGLSKSWLSALVMGVHAIIGFEGDSLRRWSLERRGWRSVGTVSGRNSEECERRFFDAWLPGEPMISGTGRELSRNPVPAGQPYVETLAPATGAGRAGAAMAQRTSFLRRLVGRRN